MNYGKSLFTAQEREALANPDVARCLDAYRKARTPYNLHQLNTALVLVGIESKRARDLLIGTLMRTRRWGDNG